MAQNQVNPEKQLHPRSISAQFKVRKAIHSPDRSRQTIRRPGGTQMNMWNTGDKYLEIILFNLAIQGAFADTKYLSSLFTVAIDLFQGFRDSVLFHVAKAHVGGIRSGTGQPTRRTKLSGDIAKLDRIALAHHSHRTDGIAELADIARPVV